MAAETATALPSLRFRLPGTWAQIPLHDAEQAREAVKKLVARQLGSTDEVATAREQLRRQFTEALKDAIAGEAQSMQIALEIIEGLPTPASFTVFLPTQQITPAVGTSATAVMEVLEQGIAVRPELKDSVQKFTTAESEVLRTHRYELVTVDEGAEPMKVLLVDYWMTVPGTKRFVLVNFHTALADAATEMMSLFDAIVTASYWRHPVSEPAGAAGRVPGE